VSKTTYHVYISPVHAVQVSADDLEVVQNVLQFKRDGKVCGQFSQYLGWLEMLEEKKEPGTLLSIVPSTPPTGEAV